MSASTGPFTMLHEAISALLARVFPSACPSPDGNGSLSVPLVSSADADGKKSDAAQRRGAILQSLLGVSVVVCYFFAGTLFYVRAERHKKSDSACTSPEAKGCGWSLIDSLYFSVVSMSTVGYGDLTPSSEVSQGFTLVYIFVGIIVVFPLLALGVTRIFEPLFEAARRPFEYCFPPKHVDIDGDGVFDFEMPTKYAAVFYLKNLMPPVLIILLFQVLSSAVFVNVESDWTIWMGFYHCMVTATTVGYGDVSIKSQAGRLCASLHILVSVAILGALIGDIDVLRERRAKSLKRAEQLKRKLDPELIRKLDKDGDGVDKLEFLIGTLIHLDVVPRDEIDAYLKQFDKLDVTGDGRLTSADLVGLQHNIKVAHAATVKKLGIKAA